MSLWKFDPKRLRVDEGAVRKCRKIPQHENPDFTWGLNFGGLRALPPNRFGATPIFFNRWRRCHYLNYRRQLRRWLFLMRPNTSARRRSV
jgi:hypothetical protein